MQYTPFCFAYCNGVCSFDLFSIDLMVMKVRRNGMLQQEKAVVVFSGGQDSTRCLFCSLERFAEVEVVPFNYGQRHALELPCAAAIAEELGVQQHVLDMGLVNQLAPNAL